MSRIRKRPSLTGCPEAPLIPGLADFILSPEATVDEILNFSNNPTIIKLHEKEMLFLRRRNFYSDLYYIKKGQRHRLYQTISGQRSCAGIERRMVVTHSSSLADYVRLLGANTDESNTLAKEILIGVTSFFQRSCIF